MSESRFQSQLIKELKNIFDGCIVLKNDASYMQGVPDILILYENKWAMLEVKASLNSPVRPNQEYYVDILNDMSFARFICPENKEEVLDDLQHTFRI